MKRLGNILRLVLCLGVVAVALGVPTSSPAGPPGPPTQNVNVVNTPLPVQGTVNVGNFPATQPVSGSVTISGTPSVRVTGTVQAQTSIPAEAFSVVQFHSTSSVISGPDSAGTNYAITSVTFANPESSAKESFLSVAYGSTSDCVHFSPLLAVIDGPHAEVPANGTVHLSFPQPFIFATQPGAASCLMFSAETDTTVVGYKF